LIDPFSFLEAQLVGPAAEHVAVGEEGEESNGPP